MEDAPSSPRRADVPVGEPAPADTATRTDAEATRDAPEGPAADATVAGSATSDADGNTTTPDEAVPARGALAWVDADALERRREAADLDHAATPYVGVAADLLADRPHRRRLRPGTVVPVLSALALAGAYTGATLLWPLTAVAPTAAAVDVASVTAPASALEWPAAGEAAVAVEGIGAPLASSGEAVSMASVTKLVTTLMALEQMPLAPGEDGPQFAFTARDRALYTAARARGESALPVPVGASLSERQMLQGILIGSAGNWAERLVSQVWPSHEVFARAAATWLDAHGLTGITVVDPTGIDPDNRADPASVVALAERAMADPVIAEIVRTREVVLPGAGTVENTNPLLADPSVAGIKTGTLTDWYNLVAAKDVTVGDTSMRVYATVLGQPSDEARDDETARLLDAVGSELAQPHPLPAGTVAGVVSTPWGESVQIVTDADADVALWNGATGTGKADLNLGDADGNGDEVGSLTVTGPVDSAEVGLHLAGDIEPPTPWWRLSHPLELWGLIG